MFEVGDRVVHPTHGAGVVIGIESNEIIENFSRYYIIDLAAAKRKLMVPVEQADVIGLRSVVGKAKAERALGILLSAPDELPDDFRQRQDRLTERLKSGDISTVAEVVRNLSWRSRQIKLSSTDQRLFDWGKEMLAGELALAQRMEVEEVMGRIESALSSQDKFLPDTA